MTIRGWLASSYYARTRNSAWIVAPMLFLACALSYTRAHAQEATAAEQVRNLLSADPLVRAAAEKSLLAAGPSAVPEVVAGAETGRRRLVVVRLLVKMGPPAMKALIGLLDDPAARSTAGSLLFQAIGPDSHELAAPLLKCLHDPAVQGNCGGALVKAMSPRAGAQTPLLIKALGDGDPAVRAYAAGALGQIGPKAAAAAPALVATLKAPEPGVRASAATALGKIGVKTPAVVAALRAAKKDPDADASRAAIDALKRLHV